MAKKKAAKKEPRKCGHEAFVIEQVHRSAIANAPYNPRVISDHARERLRKNLAKVGLTHPLTWNRRTGNLLAGHQRIRELDTLERTADYVLTVAVVDLDEATERAQNVFENNPRGQGEFDDKMLQTLMKEPSFDLEASGFTPSDVMDDYGAEALSSSSERMQALSDALREAQKRNEEIKKKSADTNAVDFFRVVVFATREEAERLSAFAGEGKDMLLHGGRLMGKLARLSAAAGEGLPDGS